MLEQQQKVLITAVLTMYRDRARHRNKSPSPAATQEDPEPPPVEHILRELGLIDLPTNSGRVEASKLPEIAKDQMPSASDWNGSLVPYDADLWSDTLDAWLLHDPSIDHGQQENVAYPACDGEADTTSFVACSGPGPAQVSTLPMAAQPNSLSVPEQAMHVQDPLLYRPLWLPADDHCVQTTVPCDLTEESYGTAVAPDDLFRVY